MSPAAFRPSLKATPVRKSPGSRLSGSSQASNLIIKTIENAINSTSAIFIKRNERKKESHSDLSRFYRRQARLRHQSCSSTILYQLQTLFYNSMAKTSFHIRFRSRFRISIPGEKDRNFIHSPVIVDETRLQGIAVECRRDEGAGYGEDIHVTS